MGEVYLALDPKFDRRIALKVMSAVRPGIDDPLAEMRPRFVHEALAAGRLNHPDIVTIYDAGTDRATGRPFIAMEWVDGESLRVRLRRKGPMTVDDAVTLVARVARALDYAHRQGVVHRDVKPANLLVRHDDQRPKVADFGVAKLVASSLTLTGQILGSPNYMSPEQVRSEPVDGRADLFSLGAVLYECLSGRPPFAADHIAGITYKVVHVDPRPVRMYNADVPDDVARVLDRLLAKDPDERPDSGAEVAELLDPRRGSSVSLPVGPARLEPGPSSMAGAVGDGAAGETVDARDSRPAERRRAERRDDERRGFERRQSERRELGGPDETPSSGGKNRLVRSLLALILATLTGFVAAHLWLSPPFQEEMSVLTRRLGIFQAQPDGDESSPEASRPELPVPTVNVEDPGPDSDPAAEIPTDGGSDGAETSSSTDEADSRPEATPDVDISPRAVAPPPPAEATPTRERPRCQVTFTLKHRFKKAYLSIWVDGRRMTTRPLDGGPWLQRRMSGDAFELTLALTAGKHKIEAHISGLSGDYEGRGSIVGELRPGGRMQLDIDIQRRPEQLNLRWRNET